MCALNVVKGMELNMEILNRKAKHDYFIEEIYEAGIVLTGTEIKSIRNGNCNIKDCYGIIRNHEVYLLNMFIALIEKVISLIMKRVVVESCCFIKRK